MRGTAFLVVLYFGTIYDEIKFGWMDGEVGMGKAREVRENEGGDNRTFRFQKAWIRLYGQVAPMCDPVLLMVPWVHASLHPGRHLDRFLVPLW